MACPTGCSAECITSRFEGDVTSGAELPDISAKPSVHDVC